LALLNSDISQYLSHMKIQLCSLCLFHSLHPNPIGPWVGFLFNVLLIGTSFLHPELAFTIADFLSALSAFLAAFCFLPSSTALRRGRTPCLALQHCPLSPKRLLLQLTVVSPERRVRNLPNAVLGSHLTTGSSGYI
jgi:hypothetical protein